MNTREILARVSEYYGNKIAAHGPTPQGVDWNSAESQDLRFRQLLKICEGRSGFSLNDFGCGYGALLDHMTKQGFDFTYTGFEIAEAMVAAARARHSGREACRFVLDDSLLEAADYTLASGIFNVKLAFTDEVWQEYVLVILDRMNDLSRDGFAFNCLTRYSDHDRMRPHLYYADPGFLFAHCKARFSRRVALLHDYPLYEFTVLVRREGGAQ